MSKKRGKVSKKEIRSLFDLYKVYVSPYKGTYFIGFLFLIATSSVVLIFPKMIGRMIDNVGAESDASFFGMDSNVGIIFSCLLLLGVTSFFRIVLFAKVSENAMANVRKDLFTKTITLPVQFFEKNRIGDITTRITNDVTLLRDTLSTTSAELFRQIIVLVGGIIFLFFTSVQLTLVMLCSFPVLILCAIIIGKKVKALSKETQDRLGETNVIVEESLHSINTVKSFTNEVFEIKRFDKGVKLVLLNALKNAKYRGVLASFIITGIFGAILLVMWRGAILVNTGAISQGDLISFVVYTLVIGASVAGIGDILGQISKAAGASDRVQEILAEKEEFNVHEKGVFEIEGGLEFKNVSFAYPMRKEFGVLKDVSLSIAKGKKLALVGQSGSGKSTVIKLLLRFYDDYAGQITIGDKDIQSLELGTFRSYIGLVPQEVLLFGGTIFENILYGNHNATKEEVIAAAEQANAMEFIRSFPEGMETLVGERGVQLSGGQRQRIAIARTILKDPSILVLDEATSSLDAESESLVQDALNKLMENRTTIIIAHRLSTIQHVDEICVLDQGEIIEQGTHNELIEREDGVYNKLCKMQFQTASV